MTEMRSLSIALATAFAVACGSSSDAATGTDADSFDVCHPAPGATGNELGVGSYCSIGGGECSANGPRGATACAAELDPEGTNFCILLFCKSNEACGADACCTGRDVNGPHACVPRACVVQGDAPCPAYPAPDAGN